MTKDFPSFLRRLDAIRNLAEAAYKAASEASSLADHPDLPFSGRVREQTLVTSLLDHPDMTVSDFYLLRKSYEESTGVLSDIERSDLGLENTNPATQTFIHTFYDTVRGSNVD